MTKRGVILSLSKGGGEWPWRTMLRQAQHDTTRSKINLSWVT